MSRFARGKVTSHTVKRDEGTFHMPLTFFADLFSREHHVL